MSAGAAHRASLVAGLFGVGRWPLAPGTWASLVAAVPAWPLAVLGGRWIAAATAAGVVALATWVAHRVCVATGEMDPSWVVIDEVAGVLVTFALCPHTVPGLLSGLVLFRVFDIAKPFPCGLVHRRLHRPPGVGVVVDDVLAALWAAGTSWAITALLGSA